MTTTNTVWEIEVEFYYYGMMVRKTNLSYFSPRYDVERGVIDIMNLHEGNIDRTIVVKQFLENAKKGDFIIHGDNAYQVKVVKKYD